MQAEPVKPDLTKLSDAEAEALEPKEQAQRYKVRCIMYVVRHTEAVALGPEEQAQLERMRDYRVQ